MVARKDAKRELSVETAEPSSSLLNLGGESQAEPCVDEVLELAEMMENEWPRGRADHPAMASPDLFFFPSSGGVPRLLL